MRQFNKVIGRKLEIADLSSVFISIGTTASILTMLGNVDQPIQFLVVENLVIT